jgi:hypothetical protein
MKRFLPSIIGIFIVRHLLKRSSTAAAIEQATAKAVDVAEEVRRRELIEFVYAQGKENVAFHIESLKIFRAEATSTLTWLIAGAGAAMGAALNWAEKGASIPLIVALWVLSTSLFTVAALLIAKCMLALDVHTACANPKSLLGPKYTDIYHITDLRAADLKNLQDRCDHNARVVDRVAGWLNRCRQLVLMTPLIFLGAWACSEWALAPKVREAGEIPPFLVLKAASAAQLAWDVVADWPYGIFIYASSVPAPPKKENTEGDYGRVHHRRN